MASRSGPGDDRESTSEPRAIELEVLGRPLAALLGQVEVTRSLGLVEGVFDVVLRVSEEMRFGDDGHVGVG